MATRDTEVAKAERDDHVPSSPETGGDADLRTVVTEVSEAEDLLAAVKADRREDVEEWLGRRSQVDRSQIEAALRMAASWGHREIAELLLRHGANPTSRDHAVWGESALDEAIRRSDEGLVRLFLDSVDRSSEASHAVLTNSLIRAVGAGHVKTGVLELLMHYGADPGGVEGGRSPLGEAAGRGDKVVLELLLKQRARQDPVSDAEDGAIALLAAADNGADGMIRLLLDAGISADSRSRGGQTALMVASFHRRVEMAELLMSRSADVQAADAQGRTPLHFALASDKEQLGDPEPGGLVGRWPEEGDTTALVKLLILNGAEVDARDARGVTPLIMSCREGYLAETVLLLEAGADLDVVSDLGSSLDLAVDGRHIPLIHLLISRGARVLDHGRSKIPSALHRAAKAGDVGTVRFLLHNGARINAGEGRQASTALMTAVQEGHLETVFLLLDRGALVDQTDRSGQTALDLVIHNRSWPISEWKSPLALALIQYGASLQRTELPTIDALETERNWSAELVAAVLEARPDWVVPALYLTLRDGSEKDLVELLSRHELHLQSGEWKWPCSRESSWRVVTRLLDAGISVDLQDAHGVTMLMCASRHGNMETLDFLLGRGADRDLRDKAGMTALMYAARAFGPERDLLKSVERLVRAGAAVQFRDSEGRTALTHAVASGNLLIARSLVARGAVVSTVESEGFSELTIAVQRRDWKMVRWLLLLDFPEVEKVQAKEALNRGGSNGDSRQSALEGHDVRLEAAGFPWPPPPYSGSVRIPREYLPPSGSSMSAVARVLEDALNDADYSQWSYHALADGFLLVTQLEQTRADATPQEDPWRWEAARISPRRISSVGDYVQALLHANQGFYRVLVFTVTGQAFSPSRRQVRKSDEAERWLRSGTNILPREVVDLPFGEHHYCMVLIYEFEKSTPDHEAMFRTAGLDGKTHLQRSGLWQAIVR